jgi:hypothetical protein
MPSGLYPRPSPMCGWGMKCHLVLMLGWITDGTHPYKLDQRMYREICITNRLSWDSPPDQLHGWRRVVDWKEYGGRLLHHNISPRGDDHDVGWCTKYIHVRSTVPSTRPVSSTTPAMDADRNSLRRINKCKWWSMWDEANRMSCAGR